MFIQIHPEEGTMSDRHPTREMLEGFLLDSLSVREAQAVIAHLMGGCVQCRELMSPLSEALLSPAGLPETEVELSSELDAAYDLAISAAYAAALERTSGMPAWTTQPARSPLSVTADAEGLPLPGDPSFYTPQVCEILLERSYAVRLSDPETMLRLADLAAGSAEGLDAEAYGHEQVADLQARAWAEVANACRVIGDHGKADRIMARAVGCRARGTGDPRILARMADLGASLACAQRRFEEAFRLLDIAHATYLELGDTHAAGRVIISRGLYAGYTGDPLDGIRFLVHGLNTIDRAREPKLAFQALHNILLLRVELGEYEEARRTLRQMQPLYQRYLSDLEQVKVRWMEGRIAAGLGELDEAEAAFLEARDEFDRVGLGYRAALVSLDVVAVWLRQGRTAEIRHLVAELMATFRAVGVEREALAGILLLRDAVECEQATLELLQLIAISLGKLDGRAAPPLDPEVR
jgi:tetratricopeptide (TPR) repeat protein